MGPAPPFGGFRASLSFGHERRSQLLRRRPRSGADAMADVPAPAARLRRRRRRPPAATRACLGDSAHARLPQRAQAWLPTARREVALLAAIALAAASLVLFGQLTDEVIEGETHAFDETVLLALRSPADPSDPIGPGWLEEPDARHHGARQPRRPDAGEPGRGGLPDPAGQAAHRAAGGCGGRRRHAGQHAHQARLRPAATRSGAACDRRSTPRAFRAATR